MGFKISWLAVEKVSKPELLERLGFEDTGVEDEVNESPFSAGELGNGRTLIWANDVTWSEKQALAALPAGTRSVACQIHEGVMYSAAHGSLGDIEQWSVVHDAQEAANHLFIMGAPPVELDAIRREAERNAAGEDSDMVDYIFDIPVDLAASLTGLRHDLWDLKTGPRARYTAIRPISG